MRILVVDDSPVIRKIIRNELAGADFEVFEAENGDEALEEFAALKPDLITLAVNLPGLSGFEVCEKIRSAESARWSMSEIGIHVPVIFVTAEDTVAGRERGFATGATDFITKPFKPGALLEAAQALLLPPSEFAGATVLVAEDGVLTRNIVINILKRFGVEILAAKDGAEALEIARANLRNLDLVISDYQMPRMNGDELCRELRSHDELAEIPILILSAKSEQESVLRLFHAGATDYIVKPFSAEELLARVNVHLSNCMLNQDLTRRNNELQDDLNLAREVQQASLHNVATAGHVTREVVYRPFAQVSGDVYDFTVNSDGCFCALLGDATGHGVGAAFMTMMVQIGLDSIGHEVPLDQVMHQLHRLIQERSGDRFVTSTYIRIAPDGELQHTSAGHPPIVIVPRDGNPEFVGTDGGLPLGMMPEALPFPVGSVSLCPGDRIIMYSDGIMEWARHDGEQYGQKRMMDYISDHRGGDLPSLVGGLAEDARKFAQGATCDDDLTIIGVQYR